MTARQPGGGQEGFQWPVRVYIEDTDAGGIVFYANYLRFMERARTERIRALGFERLERVDPQVQFVVHSIDMRWIAPAELDDELLVSATLAAIGKTYLLFDQQVRRGEALLTTAQVKVACISRDKRRPARIPEPLARSLRAVLAAGSTD